MNDTELNQALRQAGMLADVSISVWGGTRSDKDLLEQVKQQHGAHGDVGRVNKNLLAGHDGKLKLARGACNAIRQRHYEMTRPWVSDPHAQRQTGPRLITFPLFDPYMKEMGQLRRVAQNAIDDFVINYEDDTELARANLGTMASAVEYPSVDEVMASFRITFEIDPIPESASFHGLPEAALQGLRRNLDERKKRQVEGVVASSWAEVKDKVGHLIERLAVKEGDDPARFKNSTVEAVRELIMLLPGWNITDSNEMKEVAKDIEKMMDNITGDSLRRDEGLRTTTAAQAQAVVDKMRGWGL